MSSYKHSELHQEFFRINNNLYDYPLTEQEVNYRGEILIMIIKEGNINQRYNWIPNKSSMDNRVINIRGTPIYIYNNIQDKYNDLTILEILCNQKDININIINYLLENGAEPTGVALTYMA